MKIEAFHKILEPKSTVVVSGAAAVALPVNSWQEEMLIFNTSATHDIYIGHNATITHANGFPIPPKCGLSIPISAAAVPYCYQNSGGDIDVRILPLAR